MASKLQRWVDLLAALLDRRHAATFEELAREVPEYALSLRTIDGLPDGKERDTRLASLKRTFERDKQELRAFGVPIASAADGDGNNEGAYRLQGRDFYLPYLSFMTREGARVEPARVDRNGYRALASLALDHDELSAIVNAAAVVRSLGDPLLVADADNALRKLAVDLPVDAMESPGEQTLLLPRARPANRTFEVLTDALYRRKRLSFGYHALSTDAIERREVEPFGLFFLHGHWYLAARDLVRSELRNFRLNRVSAPSVNTGSPLTPDYEVPASFRLRDHAASRHAWELGESDVTRVVVAVRGTSGPALAAAKLGGSVDGSPDLRVFDVRRADTFLRWLLSSAGALVPVEPEEFVGQFRVVVNEVASLYAAPPADSSVDEGTTSAPDGRQQAAANGNPTEPWAPQGAAAQLRRVLQLVPSIADGEEHDLQSVAEAVGTDVPTLQRDLFSLVERYNAPGGFVEGIQILLEPGRVSALSGHLRRPMRLTVGELWALVLGLSVLRARRTPDEHGTIERAQEKLREVVAKLPDDPIPSAPFAAETAEIGDPAMLSAVTSAVAGRHRIRLVYRKSSSSSADARVVCPYSLVMSNGMLYLVAHCDRECGIRVFRFDRIEGVEATEDTFDVPADYRVDGVLRDGRAFQRPDAGRMRVRYSPRIARWIAEREGRAVRADGSLVMEHPLADPEWGMRHVLQYGADAEILSPPEMRERMRERLAAMSG